MKCLHCDTIVPPKDQKWWRWSGWSVYGNAPSASGREGKEKDLNDFLFHKDCFPEWLENRNGFLQDLDRPVNNCRFFERTGSSIHGYYVREGKKHACLATWLQADILGTNVIPTVIQNLRLDFDFVGVYITDPEAFIESFRNFLKKNNWFNEGWYEPRKEFVIKEEIANKHKG